MLSRMFSHLGVAFMHLLSRMPLGLVRSMGWLLGWVLYALVVPRRRVVEKNLLLCFPEHSSTQTRRLVRQTFIFFAQAWLDRSWLWHGSESCVRKRLSLTGAVDALQGTQPTVIFAPHFVGMDAGATALNLLLGRPMCSIYTDQANKVLDAWIYQGRKRFGQFTLLGRAAGVRPVVTALREGQPLYLLPDMNFGPEESIFVPFFGVQAATVPSLPRFARLGQAQVVPVISRMTPTGYQIEVMSPWTDYPTGDALADTALMNRRLEDYIRTMPAQYYWVHKRFKTRPAGEAAVY